MALVTRWLLPLVILFTPAFAFAAEDEELRMSVDDRVEAPRAEVEVDDRPLLRVPRLEPAHEEAFWGIFDDWIPWLPSPRRSWPARIAILALLGLLTFGIGKLRTRLPRSGVLPRASGFAHLLARASLFVALLIVASHLIPEEMMPAAMMVLIAMAAAIGWSLRDFFPDIFAGLVLLFEARIRAGVWISGEGFSGFVDRVGVRATWLRDVYGHREAVPNRRVLSSTLVIESAEQAMQEVRVKIVREAHASDVRAALYDAALASPWVLSQPSPVVLRDPRDERAWIVRAKLLHQKYAGRFEGELLERTEEMLAARTAAHETDDEPAR